MNLLIGTAEDQDRLEKYLTKGPIKFMELCQPKNGKMKLNKNGGLVDSIAPITL